MGPLGLSGDYWYPLVADPHSNTLSLTVPIFERDHKAVIFGQATYDEHVQARGWPVVVISADLFDSFDCVNPNTIVRIPEKVEAEPDKTTHTE